MPNNGKSFRELLKEAVDVRPGGILVGVVKETDPLKIQVLSDAKLLLTESNLYIPRRMRKYTVDAYIDGSTASAGETAHSHSLNGWRRLTIDGSLKANDIVYLLSFDRGALYFVVDLKDGDD